MDPSNGDSLFNFCNYFNTMQLDKDTNNINNMANNIKPNNFASVVAGTFNNVNNNGTMTTPSTASSQSSSLLIKKPSENNTSVSKTLKKDLKTLINDNNNDHNRNHNDNFGSAGTSDKSLNSFGSESNDSNCDQSNNSETILLNLNGFLHNNNNINGGIGEQQQINNNQFGSPFFYPFPTNSNSSSPPLSQSSSASSLSEAVISTNAVFNNFNKANNNINNAAAAAAASSSTSLSSLTSLHNFCPTINTNTSQFASQSMKVQPFSSMKNDNSLLNMNAMNSLLNQSIVGNNNNKNGMVLNNTDTGNATINDISSLLAAQNNTFSTTAVPDSVVEQQLRQQQRPSALFPASNVDFSFNNNDSTDPFGLVNSQQKSTFNTNNIVGPLTVSNNNKTSTTSSLSPPIMSNSMFSASIPMFNDILDSRANSTTNNNNNNNNTNNNNNNIQMINSNVQQLQARFDYQIRLLANEINSTVQLYLNSIQMRKEQLLKQLDHVRNAYSLFLNQNANKNKIPNQLPKISFTRPDQNLFKSITSFGFITTPAFGPCCQITGEGLSMAIEGEPTCFSITARNCFNEEILIGGENIDIDIQPNEVVNHPQISFIPNTFHVQKNILDNNNGKYNVTYMIPRGSGLHSIRIFISVNGLATTNSPFVASIKTERLRENWKLIAMYGEEGTEPGKFCRPWGIAIQRLPIQKDPNHKLMGDHQPSIPINSKSFYTWTSGQFKKDYLIAVADRSNNRVQLLKLTITDLSSNNNNTNANPSQFLLNSNNGNPKVEISVLHTFGNGPGTRPGLFDRPAGIAINANLGQLVVADKDNHRIQVFDFTGGFLFKFGDKGSRPGQFCYPWDVAICPQTSMILVSDTRNRRVQLFTHFGQYLWHCAQPLDSPRGVAFLTPDRFIISDFNKHRLLIIDKNESNAHTQVINHRDDLISSKYIGFGEGSAWGEFLRPQGLVALLKQTSGVIKYVQILCADSRNNRIAIYNSLNQNFDYINDEATKIDSLANINTSFDRPSGIAMTENLLAVVDFGNNRLQIFQNNAG